MQSPIYTVNATGRRALIEWLSTVLLDPSTLTDRTLDAWIADAELGADAQQGRAYVEVPARLHRLGRAEEYIIPSEGVSVELVEA